MAEAESDLSDYEEAPMDQEDAVRVMSTLSSELPDIPVAAAAAAAAVSARSGSAKPAAFLPPANSALLAKLAGEVGGDGSAAAAAVKHQRAGFSVDNQEVDF
jgi:hypothetical protein